MKPPTLQEVEAYVREKDLQVDPEWFWNYFDAGDWIDSRNNAVRSWKQKLWTHHRQNLMRGKVHKCYCGKRGVYIAGHDAEGFAVYRCIDHKPKPKPLPLPKNIIPIMQSVPSLKKESVSNRVNEQVRKLEGTG